jgi:hypothetical protein
VVVGVEYDEVGVGIEVEGSPSVGNGSPGTKARVEFFAMASWVLNVSVEFALTAPIIPSLMQAPGAPQ